MSRLQNDISDDAITFQTRLLQREQSSLHFCLARHRNKKKQICIRGQTSITRLLDTSFNCSPQPDGISPHPLFFTSVQKFCEHTDRRKSSPALLFDVQQRSENIPIRRTINKVTGIVFTLSVTPASSIFSLALLYCSSGVPLRTVIRQFKL